MRSRKARRAAADRPARDSHAVSTAGQLRSREANAPRFACLAIYDGRDRIGSVEIVDGGFIAIGITGKVVGSFNTLIDAARSLPVQGGS
jgi:hypothetical protein